jgi:hypothetical protein
MRPPGELCPPRGWPSRCPCPAAAGVAASGGSPSTHSAPRRSLGLGCGPAAAPGTARPWSAAPFPGPRRGAGGAHSAPRQAGGVPGTPGGRRRRRATPGCTLTATGKSRGWARRPAPTCERPAAALRMAAPFRAPASASSEPAASLLGALGAQTECPRGDAPSCAGAPGACRALARACAGTHSARRLRRQRRWWGRGGVGCVWVCVWVGGGSLRFVRHSLPQPRPRLCGLLTARAAGQAPPRAATALRTGRAPAGPARR